MLVHTVLFWLKPELSADEQASFRLAVEKLEPIPSVIAFHVGTPAATPERPVIDTSYSLMLTVVFEDMAGHDFYQDHELHHEFLANNKEKWSQVKIYDAD